MKLTHAMIVMFIGSFIINYFVMSPIMVNNLKYITYNVGKVYISTIMSLLMLFLEVMMHDHQYKVFSLNIYMFLGFLTIFFIYLYKKQVAINDKEYLKGMIEHHSMALLTSEEILQKSNNYNVIKIAKNIIQKQKDEIEEMNKQLNKFK